MRHSVREFKREKLVDDQFENTHKDSKLSFPYMYKLGDNSVNDQTDSISKEQA